MILQMNTACLTKHHLGWETFFFIKVHVKKVLDLWQLPNWSLISSAEEFSAVIKLELKVKVKSCLQVGWGSEEALIAHNALR